jgi:hypothetical protein
MSLGNLLGFITVAFILLSTTRGMVKIMLGKVLLRNKEKNVKKSFDLSLLLWLQKNHRYFGMAALLVALAHAALQFSITGVPSLTGGTLVGLLILQGVTGYLQEKGKGNLTLLNTIHRIAPIVMLVLIVLHIIYNSTYLSGLGIGG